MSSNDDDDKKKKKIEKDIKKEAKVRIENWINYMKEDYMIYP